MTDTSTHDDARARRVATLTAAARAKTQAKTHAAEQAIRALIKRGEPVTFQAVQRQAGVSHAFLYGHPELRARIEHLRAQARPPSVQTTPPDPESTLVLALTSQITHLKRHHRHEIQALHAALEQAHGENLDLRRQLTRAGHPPTPPAT
jgi:Family of unknown function (DUF6262)